VCAAAADGAVAAATRRAVTARSWELATINPGIVFGPVACRKLAASASVWQPIVQHMNGTK
jgi:hypothetical protein